MHRSSRSKARRKNRTKNRAAGANPQTTPSKDLRGAAAPAGRPQARHIPSPRPSSARAARTPAARNALNQANIVGYTRWLTQRELSLETRRSYLGTLRRLAAWLEAEHQTALLHVTREQLQQWRARLEGLAPRSIRSYVAHVHSFYMWVEIEELRGTADPSRGLIVPRAPRGIPRPIAEADVEYVIDMAIDRIRPWLVLAAYAGLRACEIATLDRERIFDKAADPYMIVIAKGGKERVVPLSPYVLGELRPVLPRRGWLFLRQDGQLGHVPKHEVTRLCNQHLRACGMTETLHKLRHRFGTQVQRAAGDIRVTQEALGHNDPKTSAGYSAVSNPDLIRAVNAVQPKGRRLRSTRRRPPQSGCGQSGR